MLLRNLNINTAFSSRLQFFQSDILGSEVLDPIDL